MKMTFRTINIILFILCFNPIFGQTDVLIPNKGIEGISIVIDSSTISDVIEIYGTDYTLSEKTLITNMLLIVWNTIPSKTICLI